MTSDPVRLHSVESAGVVVTPWTEWTFARLRAVSGASADVEITTAGDVARLVVEQVDALKGVAIPGEADVLRMLGVDERRLSGDLPLATAVSALRTSVSIIQAVEDGDYPHGGLGRRAAAQRSALRERQPRPVRDSTYTGRLRGGRRAGGDGGFQRGEVRPVRRGDFGRRLRRSGPSGSVRHSARYRDQG